MNISKNIFNSDKTVRIFSVYNKSFKNIITKKVLLKFQQYILERNKYF